MSKSETIRGQPALTPSSSDTLHLRARERWQTIFHKVIRNGKIIKKQEGKPGRWSSDRRLLKPEHCIELVKEPSIQNYCKLRSGLRNGDHVWVENFLELDGLLLLLAALEELSRHMENIKLEDVLVVLECVSCIREVLNSEPGIEYIVRYKRDETADQLAKILSTNHIAVKHQVFELLAALCTYSQDGVRLVSKCLLKYQETHKTPHALHVVLAELRLHAGDDSKASYKGVLLAFINCVLLFVGDAKRVKVVEDLRDGSFYELLSRLSLDTHSAMQVQIKALLDTLATVGGQNTYFLAAEQSVRAMFNRFESPEEQEKLLKLITGLEMATKGSEDGIEVVSKMMNVLQPEVAPRTDGALTIDQATSPIVLPDSKLQMLPPVFPPHSPETATGAPRGILLKSPSAAPQPPAPPPPPPAPVNNRNVFVILPPSSAPSSSNILSNGPPPPPPPLAPLLGTRFSGPPPPAPPPPLTGLPKSLINGVLTSQNMPLTAVLNGQPKETLKPVRWNKIFATGAQLAHSIWNHTPTAVDLKINTDQLKSFFGEKAVRRDSPEPPSVAKQHLTPELIDSKRSLKINICLKKFKDKSSKQLVELIAALDSSQFEVDDLVGLTGILPTPEEVELFNEFRGAVDELGHAESFLYWLVQLADYQLKVELMLHSQEFPTQAVKLIEDFSELEKCCQIILHSTSFKNMLHFGLSVGNVLNSGRSSGAAVAIKVDGLQKFAETASNEPKISLLHFMVEQVKKQDDTALDFLNEFIPLQKAARLQLDSLVGDFTSLLSKYESIIFRLKEAEEDVKKLAFGCMKDAENAVAKLKTAHGRLIVSTNELAEYFVEDNTQFKLEDCLKHINCFTKQVHDVIKDLEKKETNDLKAQASMKNASPVMKGFQASGSSTLPRSFGAKKYGSVIAQLGGSFASENSDERILDQLLLGIESGSPLRRRRS